MSAFQWEFQAGGGASAEKLTAALKTLEIAITRLTATQRSQATTTRTTATQIDQSITIINNYGKATNEAGNKTEGWFKKLVHGAGIFNTLNKAIRFVVDDIQWLGKAFLAPIQNIIKFGGAFETAEATLKGLYGDTAQEAIDMAEKLGRETAFTAKQAADGAIELAKAGRTATQSASELGSVLQAASANGLSLAKAANIGAVAVTMFAKTGITMKDALATMTAAANAAPVTFEAVAQSLKNVGPAAQQLNLDLRDTTAMVSLLAANTGETAGRAGTRLQMFLSALTAQTPAAAKEIQKMGIVLEDTRTGKFLPINQILDQFHDKLVQIPSDSEKAMVMKKIFGRAFTSVIPLVNAGGDAFLQMREKIDGAMGQMASQQESKTKTIVGSIATLTSAWEGLFVALRTMSSAPLQQFFTTVASLINKVTDRIKTLKDADFKTLFQGLAQAVKPELDALQSMITTGVETLVQIINGLWESKLLSSLLDVGKQVGGALIDGIVAALDNDTAVGKVASVVGWVANKAVNLVESPFKAVGAVYNAKTAASEKDQQDTLMQYIDELQEKRKSIGDPEKLKRIDQEITKSREELAKYLPTRKPLSPQLMPPSAEQSLLPQSQQSSPRPDAQRESELTRYVTDLQEARKTATTPGKTYAIDQELTKARQELTALQQANIAPFLDQTSPPQPPVEAFPATVPPSEPLPKSQTPKVDIVDERRIMAAEKKAADEKKALEDQQAAVQREQKLVELDQQRMTLQESITNAMSKAKLVIENSGAAIKQYLLNPLNAFMEAIVGIREKFGAIVDTLKTKQVDVAEKYLGTSKEAANKKRAGIVEQSMHRDRELMQVTDDEGKKREIAERLAGKAEQLAEMGVKPQEHAKEAQRLYQEAEKYAGAEEDQQIEAQKIAQDAAKERVKTLEAIAGQTDNAAEKASVLQQLMQDYQTLGMGKEAAKAQEAFAQAKIEETKEQLEIQKKQLDELKLSRELLTRIAGQGDEGMTLPVEPTAEDLG